jgi:hypothetical protein
LESEDKWNTSSTETSAKPFSHGLTPLANVFVLSNPSPSR